MPIARFEMEDGRIARFEVPEGTTPEQAMAQIQDFVSQQEPAEPQAVEQEADNPEASTLDRIRQGILDTPGGAELAEFGSGISRGATNLVDFFTTKPARAVQQLVGSEDRIPTITESLPGATTGEFVEPGLTRDILRTSGELVAPAAVGGLALRTAAKGIPALQLGQETVKQGVTRQLGTSTAAQDVTGAALSGAGQEIGEDVGGETGRLAGAILFPVSVSAITQTTKSLATTGAKKLLKDAAPTIEGLKQTARGVYKEIDDTGAVINSRSVDRLSRELETLIRKQGFNKKIHPKVSAAIDEFKAIQGTNQSVTNLDTLRKVAQAAARSSEPDEARLGSMLIGKIDDFMDNVKPKDFIKDKGVNIGAKYRDARQLWRRAKKSEMLEEAFDKAKNQATGFENGLRVQFRAILNNKKKLAGFTKDEIDAMKKVVRGGPMENTAKMLGRFGFSEGQASNMLMGSLGVAGGAAVGGPGGAVAVPLIGQLSRGLAQKLTRNNAQGAELIVRAGNNANNVVKAYMKAVPAKERSAQELTQLLLRPDVALSKINIKSLPKSKLITDAVFLANALQETE